MSWARLDDRFHGNPKVLQAWLTEPAAVGLYVMGITYCSQHETDGHIHDWFVSGLVQAKAQRVRLVNALTSVGLWAPVEGGWAIPDYLDYNPSHDQLEAKRVRERERRKEAA